MRIKKEQLRLIPKKKDKAEVTNIEFNRDYVWLEGYTKSNRKRTLVIPFDTRKAKDPIPPIPSDPYNDYTHIAVPILEGYYLISIPALKNQEVNDAIHLFDNVFNSYEMACIYIEYSKKGE